MTDEEKARRAGIAYDLLRSAMLAAAALIGSKPCINMMVDMADELWPDGPGGTAEDSPEIRSADALVPQS